VRATGLGVLKVGVEILRFTQDDNFELVWRLERLGIGHGRRGDSLRR
jgi:hypothetical protein